MSKLAFVDLTGQVMAYYKGCRPGGTHWQDQGFVEVEVPDGIRLTRDKRLTIEDRGGKKVAVAAQDFVNPVQPAPPPPPPVRTTEEKLAAVGLTREELAAFLGIEEKPVIPEVARVR